MGLSSASVARASAKKPWMVAGTWIVILVISFGLTGALLADSLTTDFSFTDNPDSEQAETLLKEELRDGQSTLTETVVIQAEIATVDDEAYSAYVAELEASLNGLVEGGNVVGAFSYLNNPQAPISQDRRTTLLPVIIGSDDFDILGDVSLEMEEIIEESAIPAGFTVLIAGQGALNRDFNELAEEGLQKGETIGIVIALIILIIVFGAVVAAVVPIILAVVAIIVAFGLTALIGQLFELSFFVTNMITMIGLAVGIDYSLFIVSRYREERLRGYEKVDAIERAGGTASRAVFFSGLIVVLALSSMLIVPNTIFRSLGTGMIVVVIVAVAAALTLLPAVLSLMGDRVNSLRVRRAATDADKRGGIWDRIGGAVTARPVVSIVLSVGVLLFFSSFYLQLESGFSGVETLPEDVKSKQAFDMLAADFPAGGSLPVEIVVDGEITDEVTEAIASLQTALADVDVVASSEVTVNEAGNLALISAPLTSDFQAVASSEAVELLRAEIIPDTFEGLDVAVLVGGAAAFNVDFFDDADEAQPIVFLWVLGLAFILLTVMFRSLVISATSILMNLLSVGAAYGLIVLFFQEGVGLDFVKDISSAVGFITVGAIEAWLPLMLFAILFGLSMDYQIFLLSRIKEDHDKHGDTTEAVATGIRSTGAIITGAALIMVAVFGGFALGDLAALQQMGFGLAIAVFIDATVIRMILVPATMKILGDKNWYLPKWLEWMPEFSFEASSEGGPALATAGAGADTSASDGDAADAGDGATKGS